MAWLKFLTVTSFRSLTRSPRRTLISLMSIAAAAAAMLLFQSFVGGIKISFRHNVVRSIYAHYSVAQKGFENDEKEDPFAYQMENIPEIKREIESKVGPLEFFGRRQRFFGLISYNDRSYGGVGWGIDAKQERNFLTLMQVKQGKHLADSDENSIFVSTGLASKLRLKIGDLTTLLVTTSKGSINALDLVVTGIYATGITELDRSTYVVHHATAEQLLDTNGAHEVLLAFKDDQDLPYKEGLENLLATKYPDLHSRHWRIRAPFYDNTMAWLESQIYVFRLIVLLIATLSIVNVFTMSLMERTGEFGTLRAIGTHRREIGTMIFGESMVQALVGSVAGILFALFIIVFVMKDGITMPPPPLLNVPFHVDFIIPWLDVAVITVVCALVSGGAGILPAYKISRMNIIKALGRNV